MIENLIVAAILVVIIGGAIAYIIKEKKKGVRCIGCPAAGQCSAKRKAACGGDSHNNQR